MNEMLTTAQLQDCLQRAINSVSDPSPSQSRLLEKLRHLQERLKTERFQLAVLGQFKRGKSTLLNGLLGVDLLPTSVIPLTAIPTYLHWGESLRMQITFLDDQVEELDALTTELLREQLRRYVSEEANPENRLGVEKVDVFLPAPLLKKGVVLIDTPGVGSTFQHNTDTAEMVLPECDAALFVVSPDPPMTAVELAYLSQIRSHVSHLIIVLNKVDLLEPADRSQAEAFLDQVLKDNAEVTGNALRFSLSARNALRAMEAHDEKALNQSGFPELESYLINFLAQDKQAALAQAIVQKASAIIGNLQFEMHLALKALSLPVEALQDKLNFFDQAARQFEVQRRMTQDLLLGDQKRLLTELEEAAEALRKRAQMEFESQLDYMLAQGKELQIIRQALATSVPVFFKDELETLAKDFQMRLVAMLELHLQMASKICTTAAAQKCTTSNLLNFIVVGNTKSGCRKAV